MSGQSNEFFGTYKSLLKRYSSRTDMIKIFGCCLKIFGCYLLKLPVILNQSAEGAGGLGIIRSNKVGETE